MKKVMTYEEREQIIKRIIDVHAELMKDAKTEEEKKNIMISQNMDIEGLLKFTEVV